ncbi:unnamed protein product [Camellia sinensis]
MTEFTSHDDDSIAVVVLVDCNPSSFLNSSPAIQYQPHGRPRNLTAPPTVLSLYYGSNKVAKGGNFDQFVNYLWWQRNEELKLKHKGHLAVYNHTLATILVEYASAVYMSDLTELFTWTCSRCDDLTEMVSSCSKQGFEVIDIIFDVKHCLQGFVGMAKDLNAIVIAFRGTQERSLQNWIEDLYWKQLDLNYPGMPDAMVHHGFYFAYHNTTVRSGVVNAVKRAKQLYGDIDIMVTGHSMGGAMAVFCGLDLKVNHEARNVQVMTFGQPRIGNAAFASYYSQLVPNTIRVTNDHDIVPHLPSYYPHFAQKTYHHFPREVWIHQIGFGTLVYKVEKVCDGSGEDPSCSRSVVGKSISDHLEYYGVQMSGESTCRIAMDPRVASYSTQDLEGMVLAVATAAAAAFGSMVAGAALSTFSSFTFTDSTFTGSTAGASGSAVDGASGSMVAGATSLAFSSFTFTGSIIPTQIVVGYTSDFTELFTWTCSRCHDLTEQGFDMIDIIFDVKHCLQGFVRMAKDLNAIVIAFRGTQECSLQNWIEDLYWKQLDLNYLGMPDAMVCAS